MTSVLESNLPLRREGEGNLRQVRFAEETDVKGTQLPKMPLNRKGDGDAEVWMYQSPNGKTRNSQPVAAPPLSQIFASAEAGEDQWKSKGFSETDSTYVKLAKSGGRRDLLTYTERAKTSQVRVETQWPEWMDHNGATEAYLAESRRVVAIPEKPEWAVYNQQKSEVADSSSSSDLPYQFQPPFSMQDNSHHWNREEESLKLPQIRTRRARPKPMTGRVAGPPWTGISAQPPQKSMARKLPRIREEKGPVSMTHLLANGYQDDWLERRRQRQMEDQAREERQQAERKRIVQRAQNTRRLLADQDGDQANKPAFKLSRFANVPSRVKTYSGTGEHSQYS